MSCPYIVAVVSAALHLLIVEGTPCLVPDAYVDEDTCTAGPRAHWIRRRELGVQAADGRLTALQGYAGP